MYTICSVSFYRNSYLGYVIAYNCLEVTYMCAHRYIAPKQGVAGRNLFPLHQGLILDRKSASSEYYWSYLLHMLLVLSPCSPQTLMSEVLDKWAATTHAVIQRSLWVSVCLVSLASCMVMKWKYSDNSMKWLILSTSTFGNTMIGKVFKPIKFIYLKFTLKLSAYMF